MSDLLHIAKGLSLQPKRILVLGARTEAMLNWLFSLTATQVVLVEPEPAMFDKANALYNAKGKPENLSIEHGIPAFESEQKATTYFASNVPGFSSVLPPNVIKRIRPALEFTEQEAPVIQLKPLLEQLNISESEPCLLITQLNGGEQQCLNNHVFNAFTHVVIQSSLKPVFGENKPIEKLKKQLVECGRDYLELAESMPPYSNFVAIKKVNTTQALNYFSQRHQHREIKDALENQLSASQSNTKKTAEELQQAKQQLQTDKQQGEEKQRLLGEELKQTKEQLQIAKQQVEEKDKQQTKLTQEFAQLKNEKELQKESFTVQIEKASESENRHVKAVEITSKLNLKLHSDLDDLRSRFAEKVKAEKELNELISELYVKLRQAANFYYQLEEKHPELTDFADE